MKNFDEIDLVEEDGTLLFIAKKSSTVRNLNGEEVEKNEEEVLARIPDEREVGMEIGEQLFKRFARVPPQNITERIG